MPLLPPHAFGNSISNSIIYTTLQPCFTCLKEFLQAKVKQIYYLEELHPKQAKTKQEKDFVEQYNIMLNRFEKIPEKADVKGLSQGLKNMKKYLDSLAK